MDIYERINYANEVGSILKGTMDYCPAKLLISHHLIQVSLTMILHHA